MPAKDLEVWFIEEILPLEPMLTRFLLRNWRDRADIPDLRQEVYTRLCEAALRERPSQVKAFLFVTARNLMIDRARRARVISIEALEDLESLNLPLDEPLPDRQVSARQELRRLQQALNSLPERFRDVLILRKVEGLSLRETAARLCTSEDSVEHHSGKGMRLLADAMFGRGEGEAKNKGAEGAVKRQEDEP